jgi:hypothetical protein
MTMAPKDSKNSISLSISLHCHVIFDEASPSPCPPQVAQVRISREFLGRAMHIRNIPTVS